MTSTLRGVQNVMLVRDLTHIAWPKMVPYGDELTGEGLSSLAPAWFIAVKDDVAGTIIKHSACFFQLFESSEYRNSDAGGRSNARIAFLVSIVH